MKAGRDGKLREAVEDFIAKAEKYRINSELSWSAPIAITVDMLRAREALRELLAVPDPLASDTGQEERPTLAQALERQVAMALRASEMAGMKPDEKAFYEGKAAGIRQALNSVRISASAPLVSSSETQGDTVRSCVPDESCGAASASPSDDGARQPQGITNEGQHAMESDSTRGVDEGGLDRSASDVAGVPVAADATPYEGPRGTYNCPVCGWNVPHAEHCDEIIDRQQRELTRWNEWWRHVKTALIGIGSDCGSTGRHHCNQLAKGLGAGLHPTFRDYLAAASSSVPVRASGEPQEHEAECPCSQLVGTDEGAVYTWPDECCTCTPAAASPSDDHE